MAAVWNQVVGQVWTPLGGLLVALGGFGAYYILYWWTALTKAKPKETALELGTGFVTNFFDTLGIGSFAPTTAIFKFFRLVPDRLIPGTLNVGHTLPTITQAFIFTLTISVDVKTLILMIAASVAGAYLGAGVVAKWPKRYVQIGMGSALIVAAALFSWRNLVEGGLLSSEGAKLVTGGSGAGTLDLTGSKLIIGLAGNFMLGALMTLGIGLYAPCMILVGLLGMNAKAAFPIMMGSCAFLMPVSSAKFVKAQSYSPRAALALGIGGLPAVLLAALVVKEMPLAYVRWLVVAVVLIAATMMLRSAASGDDTI
jgi:uncharacterized membrane protein YfcA